MAESSPTSSPPSNSDASSLPDSVLPERPQLDPVDLRCLEYVGSYDHNLMCPICHCPFVLPVKLDCEHVFCQRCVNQAMLHQNRNSRSCPSCRRTINTSDISAVPRILTRILDELLVRCPLRNEGCAEELRRGEVQDHVRKYCDYYEVACPADDCSLAVLRKDAHEERCLHRLLPCEACDQSVMERDLQTHRTCHCQKSRTICPDCSASVLFRDLKNHIEQCPEATFPCAAAVYGCDFIAARASLNEHLGTCVLAKLMPFLKMQDERLESHETALKHLRHKNSILETSFSTIQHTLSPSANLIDAAPSSENAADPGPFDSTAHHLLCLHESLREEVSRVSAAVSELDARASMMVMNESLRVKEDLSHTNAAIGNIRMQVHWLMSARLQNQQRVAMVRGQSPGEGLRDASTSAGPSVGTGLPVRRLSDSTRQETKL